MQWDDLTPEEKRASLSSDTYLAVLKTKYPDVDFSVVAALKEKYKIIVICKNCFYEHLVPFNKIPPVCQECSQVSLTVAPNTIASWFISQYIFVTSYDRDQILYMYDETTGVYSEDYALAMITKECNILYDDKISAQKLNNTILSIKAQTYLEKASMNSLMFENEATSTIYYNIANGVLTFNKKTYEIKLLPHSPKFYFKGMYNIVFDENAEAPEKFLDFIGEIASTEENFINLIEAFAFPMLPNYPIQRSIALVGAGKNGKSTYLKALEIFYGERYISHLTLQQLSSAITGQPFALIQLTNKIANVADDLPSKPVDSVGYFKQLTGGSSVEAERKFGSRVAFTNSAKFYFAANSMPAVSEDTIAFYRRFLFIEFDNIIKKTRDQKEMLEDIISSSERSGVLNMLLLYVLPRLIAQNEFTRAKSVEFVQQQYNKYSNTAKVFFEEICCYNSNSQILKSELKNTYKKYCEINKYIMVSEKVFFRTLNEIFPAIFEERVVINKVVQRVIKGLNVEFHNYGMENKQKEEVQEKDIIKNYFIHNAKCSIIMEDSNNMLEKEGSNCQHCQHCQHFPLLNMFKKKFNNILNKEKSRQCWQSRQDPKNSPILAPEPKTTTTPSQNIAPLKQNEPELKENTQTHIIIPQQENPPQKTEANATADKQDALIRVLNAVKIMTKMDIPYLWKNLETQDPYPALQNALAGLYTNQIVWALSDLARAGDIYEPKPGRWRVVQREAEEVD